ncbi:MAG: hypothetical protein JXQ99_21765 [Hyphomicrobiaceae bacterium]
MSATIGLSGYAIWDRNAIRTPINKRTRNNGAQYCSAQGRPHATIRLCPASLTVDLFDKEQGACGFMHAIETMKCVKMTNNH